MLAVAVREQEPVSRAIEAAHEHVTTRLLAGDIRDQFSVRRRARPDLVARAAPDRRAARPICADPEQARGATAGRGVDDPAAALGEARVAPGCERTWRRVERCGREPDLAA